ncbi:unnamed protein product [Chrysoparadoxa australica]
MPSIVETDTARKIQLGAGQLPDTSHSKRVQHGSFDDTYNKGSGSGSPQHDAFCRVELAFGREKFWMMANREAVENFRKEGADKDVRNVAETMDIFFGKIKGEPQRANKGQLVNAFGTEKVKEMAERIMKEGHITGSWVPQPRLQG